jgi:AraC-like DNA-binding protein
MFASIQKFGRILLGDRPQFERLCFRHAPPPYRKEYEKFFRAPVKFRQPRYTLEMRRELLDRPLGGGFPALHEQAQVRVEQRLTRSLKRPGLVAAIEDAFMRKPQLLGQGIEFMADELNLHARTLQRRLREEGHGYGELQGRVRYRLAMQLLGKPGQAIEDVSERLGFSDRRSFTRAFKRWSGVSPAVYVSRGKR